MPRTYSSIDKICAELAWVTETPDPNKCGCRNLRCCEETRHKPGACSLVLSKYSNCLKQLAESDWAGHDNLGLAAHITKLLLLSPTQLISFIFFNGKIRSDKDCAKIGPI